MIVEMRSTRKPPLLQRGFPFFNKRGSILDFSAGCMHTAWSGIHRFCREARRKPLFVLGRDAPLRHYDDRAGRLNLPHREVSMKQTIDDLLAKQRNLSGVEVGMRHLEGLEAVHTRIDNLIHVLAVNEIKGLRERVNKLERLAMNLQDVQCAGAVKLKKGVSNQPMCPHCGKYI